MPAGSAFEREAAEIPGLVARQGEELTPQIAKVVARLDRLGPAVVATIARGSSENAAAFARYAIALRLDLPAVSVPLSIASIYGRTMRLERALVLAISQSGTSPDLALAVRAARAGGAWCVGLVNEPGSPLGAELDFELRTGAGHEQAIAATKTFVLSVTAVLHLIAAWDRDATLRTALFGLRSTLESRPAIDWAAAGRKFSGSKHVFVVGRGPALPIAQELALKLEEVPGLHAEARSAAELLHGPIATASPATPAIVFAGDSHSEQSIREAIVRLRCAGAPVLLLAPTAKEGRSDEVIDVPRAGHELLQPLVSLCTMYPFLAQLAHERGRDPDRSPNLAKSTRTL